MILKLVMGLLLYIADFLLLLLPDISGFVYSDIFTGFCDLVRSVAYFFPTDTIVTIFGVILGFYTFRLIITLLKTIWGILPLL